MGITITVLQLILSGAELCWKLYAAVIRKKRVKKNMQDVPTDKKQSLDTRSINSFKSLMPPDYFLCVVLKGMFLCLNIRIPFLAGTMV